MMVLFDLFYLSVDMAVMRVCRQVPYSQAAGDGCKEPQFIFQSDIGK